MVSKKLVNGKALEFSQQVSRLHEKELLKLKRKKKKVNICKKIVLYLPLNILLGESRLECRHGEISVILKGARLQSVILATKKNKIRMSNQVERKIEHDLIR